MTLIYEPEWSIGSREPAPPHHVAEGCSLIRDWLTRTYGRDAAERVRIIYGGSVTPGNAKELLASPDVDGLGTGRKGRDPEAFAKIIRLIAQEKKLA
jgi:triosephosphate isomerase